MEFNFLDEYIFEQEYNDFLRENKDAYNELFNVIRDKNKEAFKVGYDNGFEQGITNGEVKVRGRVIFKLLTSTKLSDQEIFEIVGEDKNKDLLEFIKKGREELRKTDIAIKETVNEQLEAQKILKI